MKTLTCQQITRIKIMTKLKLTISGLVVFAIIASIAVVMNYKQQKLVEQINTEIKSHPTAAGGTNYYVCDTGDDESVGNTMANPLKTFDMAISKFKSLNAGDSILFCRGGTFNVSKYTVLFNTNFTASSPGVIGDYFAPGATGDEPRPIISNENDGIFNFNTRNTEVPDGGLIIENLILRGNGKSRGIFFLNGYSDVKVRNVIIDGFRVGISIGGGSSSSSRIFFTDSIVRNNTEQGWLGGGNDLLIENNEFYNNGYGGSHNSYFYHNVYVSNNELSPNKNVIVRGNNLYKSAIVDGKCGGASLVVHGRMENLLIENNQITEDKGAVTQFCYGLGVGPAYASSESFKDVIIRNNKLINVGRVGISGGSLINAVIDNNYILDEGDILDEGILVPEEKNSNDARSQNVAITRNTVIANNSHAFGIVIGGSFPFTVKDNKISLYSGAKNKVCIKKFDANLNTDTSFNSCQTHIDTPEVIEVSSEVSSEIQSDILKLAEDKQTATIQAAAEQAETQASIAKNNALKAAEIRELLEQSVSSSSEDVKAARDAETAAVSKSVDAAAAAKNARSERQSNRGSSLGGSTTSKSGSSGLKSTTYSDVINAEPQQTTNPDTCRASSNGVCLLK